MDQTEAPDLLEAQIATVSDYHSSLLSRALRRRDPEPTTRYIGMLQILRDLLLQGWKLRSDDEGLILDSPDRMLSEMGTSDPEKWKEGLRRYFSFAHERQLVEPATSRFITSVEKRG